jgi:uncharacterized repeat protein (TIGR03943 family)
VVNTRVGPVLVFVVGAVVAQLGAFGGYLDYVKPTQGPLLIAAGLVLALLGIIGMLTDQHDDHGDHGDDGDHHQSDGRQERPADERRIHTHGPLAAPPEMIAAARQARREARRHDHRASPPVAVLLIIPVVMALGVSPPPLGAFTAARAGAAVPAPLARRDYPPLPPSDPVALPIHDYAERAAWDGGRTLAHRTVALTGFATPDGDGGWYLTRLVITCCAADSRSYLIGVDGGGRAPVANSWQRVTGTWVASPPTPSGGPTARITATAVTAAAAPAEPYELP